MLDRTQAIVTIIRHHSECTEVSKEGDGWVKLAELLLPIFSA